MAKYVVDESTMTGIAEQVRSLTRTDKTMTPAEMVDSLKTVNYDSAYEAGKQAGYTEGYDAGEEAGFDDGVAEHFRSYYRRCNALTNFLYAFAGVGWSNNVGVYDVTTYIPTEDMTFKCDTNSSNMYAYSAVVDTVAAVDLSKATNNVSATFANATKLVTIRKLIVSETTPAIGFTSCSKLANITFEGVIAKKLNLQWCPLSVASMKNIISCLKNFTGTGSENTVAVTFKDTCWEALEADSTAPNGGTWKNYVTDVLCWNA